MCCCFPGIFVDGPCNKCRGMPPVSEVEMAVPEEGAGGLCQSDVLCPICLEMFIEPVTLPCDHTLCKPCFLETVDKTSMCCPLCRKRVATWARHHGRNKTLVNMDLWQRIQNAFPEQCQRRLSGQEVDSSTVLVTTPKVCQPGELRREYEDEVSKLETERRAREEEERRASEEYIQRLLAEDEQLLEQQRRQQQESQEQDELLARQINQELNSDPVLQVNPQTVDITLSPKRTPVAGGIQRFFGPVRNSLNTSDSSFASNMSTDTDLEMSIFPTERASSSASCDLPHLDYYGPSTAHPKRSIWSFQDHPSSPPGSPCSSSSSSSISFVSASVCDLTNLHSPERRSGSSIPSKRKSGVLEDEEERENSGGGGGAALVLPPKRPAGAPSRLSVLQVLTQQEEELQERLRQEEEDLQLALRLQRQLEREERQRSAAAAITPYQLRQKTPQGKGKEEEGATPGRRHRDGISAVTLEGGRRSSTGKGKAPRRSQSAPSAGSPPNTATAASPNTAAATGLVKVRKQATITELFQCQNS